MTPALAHWPNDTGAACESVRTPTFDNATGNSARPAHRGSAGSRSQLGKRSTRYEALRQESHMGLLFKYEPLPRAVRLRGTPNRDYAVPAELGIFAVAI